MWIYEWRNSDDGEFRPCYCFQGGEFLPADYEVMNLGTSQSRTSWFTQAVVCVKWMLSEDGEEVLGDWTLFGKTLKKKVRGEVETVAEFGNERDRVEALERFLGVRLSEEERNGIRGMVSALPPA